MYLVRMRFSPVYFLFLGLCFCFCFSASRVCPLPLSIFSSFSAFLYVVSLSFLPPSSSLRPRLPPSPAPQERTALRSKVKEEEHLRDAYRGFKGRYRNENVLARPNGLREDADTTTSCREPETTTSCKLRLRVGNLKLRLRVGRGPGPAR